MKAIISNPPFVVFDAETIERQYRRLRDYLDQAYPKSRIFYALKACYLPPVVNKLIKIGCGLEIVTPAEHAIACHFGLKSDCILWNGPSLGIETLQGIAERGEILNVDSPWLFHLLEKLANKLGKRVSVNLRLNPSGEGRLGMPPDQAESLLKRSHGVEVNGLHVHLGRGRRFESIALAEKQRFLEIAARWEKDMSLRLQSINLGGGLTVGQTPEMTLGSLIQQLKQLRSTPELFLEPGAYLVEEAGTAYARIVSTKTIGEARWAMLDIGANFLIPLDRNSFQIVGAGPVGGTDKVQFGGPFCFEADIIAREQPVTVEPGDIVRVVRCGAYTESLSSYFFSAPPRVFWRDGDVTKELHRKTSPVDLFLAHHGYPVES
jgi:diaminopimelate decarboxylase